MKIECTENEKEAIIRTAATSEVFCLFDNTQNVACRGTQKACGRCVEENIEWVIREGNEQINKIKKEYFVMDEYGYTDKELVDTVNILVDKVNELNALMQTQGKK